MVFDNEGAKVGSFWGCFGGDFGAFGSFRSFLGPAEFGGLTKCEDVFRALVGIRHFLYFCW
jgi:hypothetical protein